jgi:hypothetical protein
MGGTKEGESQIAMESMMELMAGARDSLKEVAGGMQDLRQDREMARTSKPVEVPKGEGGLKFMMGKGPMGTSQGPSSFIQEGWTGSGEWYAIAKGKDGASGVFDNYEEAKALVYRVWVLFGKS